MLPKAPSSRDDRRMLCGTSARPGGLSRGAARGRPPAQPPCGRDQPLISKSSRPQEGRSREGRGTANVDLCLFKALALWLGAATAPHGSLWSGEGLRRAPVAHDGGRWPPTVPHCCTGVLMHRLLHEGEGPTLHDSGQARGRWVGSFTVGYSSHYLRRGPELCTGKVSGRFSPQINGHAQE